MCAVGDLSIYIYISQHTHILYLHISQPPLDLDVPTGLNFGQWNVGRGNTHLSQYALFSVFCHLWMDSNTHGECRGHTLKMTKYSSDWVLE